MNPSEANEPTVDPRRAQRETMVREQLGGRGIRDERLLDAFRHTPREAFMPTDARSKAYADAATAIDCGQTISQPYMVACMTESLEVRPTDRVLEIGTGSGYQAAILAQLAAEVYSIERHAPLAEQARAALEAVGLHNVEILVGDGTRGWPERAPFDAILVTAGAPAVPEDLKAQLADGGRLVLPVGTRDEQHLERVIRTGDDFRVEKGLACRFVPLIGQAGWQG